MAVSFKNPPAGRRRANVAPPVHITSPAITNLPYFVFFAFSAVISLPVFQVAVPGAQWLRVSNIISGLPLLVFAMQTHNWRKPDHLERPVLVAFAAYMALFTLAFVRSMPNLPIFQAVDPTAFPPQMSTYINSYFLLHVMWALPLVYVVWRFRSPSDLLQLFAAISVGIVVLSLVVVGTVALHPEALFSYNRIAMTALSLSAFGMHYNEVAEIYVIVGPLLFYLAITRGPYWMFVYLLALAAVVVLESRTGQIIFVLMNGVVLLSTGRVHLMLRFVLAMLGVMGLAVLGPILLIRASSGLYTGGGSALDTILNGRADRIWGPLLQEWTSDPSRFWFGAGEYSILTSHNRLIGAIFTVSQAHNAYLEFFLDMGLILSIVALIAVLYFLRTAWRIGRKIHDELYWAMFLCVVSFVVSCFTGRRLFPYYDSLLMFPIVGAMVNVARLHLEAVTARPAGARGG